MAVWARTSRPSTKFDCLSAESKFLMRGPSLTSCGLILLTWRHGLLIQEERDGCLARGSPQSSITLTI
jgi:hypothetical protein